MQKRVPRKKTNPFYNAHSRDQPVQQKCLEQEFVAKDMLFQLSASIDPQYSPKTPKANNWLTNIEKSAPPSLSSQLLKAQYQSVYLLPTNSSKMRTQTSQERNYEQSVIPQLKSHLQKLESPRYYYCQQKKENMMSIHFVQTRKKGMKERQERLTTPANHTRNSNASFKGKKTIYLNHFTEGKGRERQKNINIFREIQQKIGLMKQARKNRTLKKLLF